MDKENVVYIHNGISFSHKILSFATIWMRLKDMLSEISQTEKDKYCMISLTCRIQGKRRKKKTPHRKKYQICGFQRWRGRGGGNGGRHKRYTFPGIR